MQSLSDMLNGAIELVWFNTIRSYISTRIDYFLEHTLSGTLTIVGVIAVSLFTLWIMIQGFLIATGRSQEGLKGFLLDAFKKYLIIIVATGLAAGQGFSVRALTDDFMNVTAQVMAGDEDVAKCLKADASFFGCKIDRNLQTMQAAMAFIGQLDTADDPILEDKKTRASYFVGIGIGTPALVAGTMLLMYKVAIALFISTGPIFIACLLFKATRPLFQKWLYYGISTVLSSAVLAVMADISMDLVIHFAKALFVAKLFGVESQGIMQAAIQQLGLGLMLSTLLITVPPMVGNFFNGVMGQFSSYNQLGNTGMPPPGSGAAYAAGGSMGAGGVQSTSAAPAHQAPTQVVPQAMQTGTRTATGQTASNFSVDTIKSAEQSQTGNAARAYSPTPSQGVNEISANTTSSPPEVKAPVSPPPAPKT